MRVLVGMSGHSFHVKAHTVAGVALAIVTGCKAPSGPAARDEGTTAVVPVAAASAAPPALSKPAVAKLSSAVFNDDGKLLACFDYEGSAEVVAEMAKKEGALPESCDSLGQVALGTCITEGDGSKLSAHYYRQNHSDRYMAKCVNEGGKWSVARGHEADRARTQQALEAAQEEKQAL